MSRLRTSANAALAALSVPRIFSNTQRGWKVSLKVLARRLCRITCAGVLQTTKIGSPANENSPIGWAAGSGIPGRPGVFVDARELIEQQPEFAVVGIERLHRTGPREYDQRGIGPVAAAF